MRLLEATKEDFNRQVEKARELFKDDDASMQKGTMELIQKLLYNTVAAATICVGEVKATKQSGESQQDGMLRVSSCRKEWKEQWDIMGTLLSDYQKLFTVGEYHQCELEARLFERELLLPADDFLKGDGVYLVDPNIFNQCLRSKIGSKSFR
jgi:hypothetical protein